MEIERTGEWASLARWQTRAAPPPGSREWMGVAIGPGSDEGLVRINGVLCAAGRFLPLRAMSYSIERVHGVAGTWSETATLELCLYACGDVVGDVSRAPADYAFPAVAVNAAGWTRVGVVPFSGRSTAMVAPFVTGDVLGYRVIGRYYSKAEGAVKENTIVSVAAVNGSGIQDAVFFVGGNGDNAEPYYELAIELECDDVGGTTGGADVRVYGEVGR